MVFLKTQQTPHNPNRIRSCMGYLHDYFPTWSRQRPHKRTGRATEQSCEELHEDIRRTDLKAIQRIKGRTMDKFTRQGYQHNPEFIHG